MAAGDSFCQPPRIVRRLRLLRLELLRALFERLAISIIRSEYF
jgi:hypothetical protein